MKNKDIRFIRRELREAFPRTKIAVTARGNRNGFNLRFDPSQVNPQVVKRVVERWYRAVDGSTVRWGNLIKAIRRNK